MADPKELTQADIDKAVKAATDKLQESLDRLEAKNTELLDEAKKAKAELRKVKEISPEDLAALETENEKLRTDLATANKTAKDAATAAEKATKALEAEQGAARSYALEAEIASAIASGNIVPALVPALKAMASQQAKADLVDGKYAVTIGDKPAGDWFKALLDSEDGKAFRAAPVNGGGGAQGSGNNQGGGKTVDRATFDGMDQGARATFAKEGGKVVDA